MREVVVDEEVWKLRSLDDDGEEGKMGGVGGRFYRRGARRRPQ